MCKLRVLLCLALASYRADASDSCDHEKVINYVREACVIDKRSVTRSNRGPFMIALLPQDSAVLIAQILGVPLAWITSDEALMEALVYRQRKVDDEFDRLLTFCCQNPCDATTFIDVC